MLNISPPPAPDDGAVLDLSPLTLDRLAEIRAFLGRTLTALGFASIVDPCVLAVDEVCANLVEHAGSDANGDPTRVVVRRAGFYAIIEVEDRGSPFDPADAPHPDLTSSWEDRPIGGLGWFFVKQLMDDVRYESAAVDDGFHNRLTLTKRALDTASSDPSSSAPPSA